MDSKVTVLTPNGRRQIVKITTNSTLLMILEEVCQKHNEFSSDQYTLTHHNKVLSLSQTFGFSGLPRNCLLEMAKTDTVRVVADVDICVQLEDGSRKQAKFKSTDNLWNVVKQLSGDEVEKYESPAVVYMRQDIMGKEKMMTTTLKSLGILEGRALMRLVNKKAEELKTQAMVYTPPTAKSEVKKDDNDNDRPKNVKSTKGGGGGFAITKDLVKSLKKTAETHADTNSETNDKEHDDPCSSAPNVKKEESAEAATPKYDWGDAPGRSMKTSTKIIESEEEEKETEVEPEYNIIGERNALIYSLDAAQSEIEDLPDSFYDLTVHDLKLVLRDLRKIASGDVDAPLLTEKLRELENNNTMLRKISQYKHCAIRIQFPDRHVLQGMFKPIDKISDVVEFTRKFLKSPDKPFYLFTIPHKTKLQLDKTLLELDFVPNALVHFSFEDDSVVDVAVIKEDFLKELSSPEGALFAASKLRKQFHTTTITEETNIEIPQSEGPSTGAIPKRRRNEEAKKA